MDHASGVCRSAVGPREQGKHRDEQERGVEGGSENRFVSEDNPSTQVARWCGNDERKQSCRCMERNTPRKS